MQRSWQPRDPVIGWMGAFRALPYEGLPRFGNFFVLANGPSQAKQKARRTLFARNPGCRAVIVDGMEPLVMERCDVPRMRRLLERYGFIPCRMG